MFLRRMRASCLPEIRGLHIWGVVGTHQPLKPHSCCPVSRRKKTQDGQYAFSSFFVGQYASSSFFVLLLITRQSFLFLNAWPMWSIEIVHDCFWSVDLFVLFRFDRVFFFVWDNTLSLIKQLCNPRLITLGEPYPYICAWPVVGCRQWWHVHLIDLIVFVNHNCCCGRPDCYY